MIRPAVLLALTSSVLLAAACHGQAKLNASEADVAGAASVEIDAEASEAPAPQAVAGAGTAAASTSSSAPPSSSPPAAETSAASTAAPPSDEGNGTATAAPLSTDKDRIDPPPDGVSQLHVPGGIVFATGKSEIVSGPETDAVVALVRQFLDEHPEVTKLRIEGHTDSKGKDAANDELSKARARAVADRLVANGVARERLLPVGFGSRRPLFANESNRGRAVNRRIEFHIAEMDGKPYMGADPLGGGLAE